MVRMGSRWRVQKQGSEVARERDAHWGLRQGCTQCRMSGVSSHLWYRWQGVALQTQGVLRAYDCATILCMPTGMQL